MGPSFFESLLVDCPASTLRIAQMANSTVLGCSWGLFWLILMPYGSNQPPDVIRIVILVNPAPNALWVSLLNETVRTERSTGNFILAPDFTQIRFRPNQLRFHEKNLFDNELRRDIDDRMTLARTNYAFFENSCFFSRFFIMDLSSARKKYTPTWLWDRCLDVVR